MHPWEEMCFTVNQNEWRWMKSPPLSKHFQMSTALLWWLLGRQSDHLSVAFSSTPQLLHTLSHFSKPSLVHGNPPVGRDCSCRHLLSFMWTLIGSNRTGFTLTAAYLAVILQRFCFVAVQSRHALLCFHRHLADSRAGVVAPSMRMCISVGSLSLLTPVSICLWAIVSWSLGISGPGGVSGSEFELTVCHCHNIKATIRHTDTSVRSSSSSSSPWHMWAFMFLLSCPDLSALSMIILLSNCSWRGGARTRWKDPSVRRCDGAQEHGGCWSCGV